MHSYYTEIPERSYAAIVKNGYLSEVLVALLVDPLEAEDVAESIKSRTGTTIKLEVNERVFSAPIELADFQGLPSKDAFEKLKITLSQWAMTTGRADDALRVLTMWDRRFGVWCACQVAREALRFVPKDEQRPLRAIETAEAWVVGKATTDDVRSASAAAADAYAYAAYAATYGAAYAVAAADDAASAARFAAYRAADAAGASASAAANVSELAHLCTIVSDACLSFPG